MTEPVVSTRMRDELNTNQSPRSRPIHIAFTVHTFDTGGQERCISQLVNHLPRDVAKCVVVSFKEPGSAVDWIKREDVPIISLGKSRPNDPWLALRLARIFRTHRIDVAHSHNWGTLLETAFACRLTGAAHVHAEHGLGFSDATRGFRARLKNALRKRAFQRVTALVAIADCVKTRLINSFQCHSDHIMLIRNGVERPFVEDQSRSYFQVRNELGLPPDSLIAGSIGRIARVKGFDIAVEAFYNVAARLPQAHIVLIGDGPELKSLQLQCHELKLENRVHFAGHQNDIGRWLSAFDVYFNSSRSEAMNLSILEAMALGIPIAAMDVGDNSFLLEAHGKCGIIVGSGDTLAFSAALESLLNNTQLQRRFGMQAKLAYANAFTLDRMVCQYAELYSRIVPERGS